MIYLATPNTTDVRNAVSAGRLGALIQPRSWAGENAKVIEHWPFWVADNDCFAQGDKFDAEAWLTWLAQFKPHADSCLFATLPDVVGDAAATYERSMPYVERVRELGFPVAYVVQEGVQLRMPPWDQIDAVFIGGLTEEFKFGEGLIAADEARHRGLWTHMGRVNSFRRLRAATLAKIDSADGTYLAFGPDKNLPKLLTWLTWLDTHMPFHFEAS